MFKLGSIGMIDKNAKGDPTIKAHAEIINGYLHTIAAGKTAAPVAAVAAVGETPAVPQTKEIRMAMNTGVGDNQYKDFNISKDDYVNSMLLKEWDGQYLIVNEKHITYATNDDYSDITAGTTKMVAGTDGKFAVASDVTGYGIYFEVAEKVTFAGNAVKLKIVVA